MNASFHFFDWTILCLYFLATMGIGFYFYRRTRNEEGYTTANRSLPGWVCGLSIFATFLSSISYLALPGKTFAANWNPFVFSLSIPIVACISVRYFLPYYRKSGEVSAYALLENRFGLWARVYASFFYLLTQIARIAVVLYLMALPMQVIFGWDIYTIILVTGFCVTLYAFIGGITAVIWTDAIQAIVLMAGAVLCLIVMLFQIPGGLPAVFEAAAAGNKFSLGDFGPSLAIPTFWVVLLYGIAINLQNFGIDQSYIQRYIASSSDKEARRSIWLGALLYVPVSALFFFIGTTLFAFYKSVPEGEVSSVSISQSEFQTSEGLFAVKKIVARQKLLQQGHSVSAEDFSAEVSTLASSLEPEEIGDRVFPYFIATRLPPGIRGLLIAAIFAAAMSTVSTSLNSSATLLMSDYFKRFINPRAGNRQTMLVLYGGTILWGILGTGLSLLLVRLTESALDIWWTMSGILGGGMSGLFLLGMISRKAKNPSAITAVIAAVALILWLSFPKLIQILLFFPVDSPPHSWATSMEGSSGGWSQFLHAYMVPVFATLVILLVGLAISRIARLRVSNGKSSLF
ncbi:MAG: sodium:solute symporter [Verrucomicrobia bacterium]|nr:sodium:solute symporter [Verrucomicrobiota bacterium]MDA1068840.1 sodium:solute symporter [Verrucomicrobiota bacterium]